ncbi:MAG: D-amino-acid transaminase [Proteobacteria bacterium]|nr:D-amino-acid transaminase [Pseudomonadota bacterium]
MSKGWNDRAPAGRLAYVDGRYVAHGSAGVHIEDRALQLGDGIYEVCGVEDAHLMDEEEHLDRLERSLREIELTMPMSRTALKLVMRELVRRNRVRDGLLYLQVTRGAVRRDHPIPERSPRPTLILTTRAMSPDVFGARRRDGVAVITRPDERWGRCDIKTVQLLPNLLAKTAARRAGAYEAWLIDEDGVVTEGSSTTAWIVDAEGKLRTRALSNAILPGVTRRVILEAVAAAQFPVREESFRLEDTATAREAFISSATGVMPVTRIDGKPVGDGRPGPVTRRIQELYSLTSAGRAGKTGK